MGIAPVPLSPSDTLKPRFLADICGRARDAFDAYVGSAPPGKKGKPVSTQEREASHKVEPRLLVADGESPHQKPGASNELPAEANQSRLRLTRSDVSRAWKHTFSSVLLPLRPPPLPTTVSDAASHDDASSETGEAPPPGSAQWHCIVYLPLVAYPHYRFYCSRKLAAAEIATSRGSGDGDGASEFDGAAVEQLLGVAQSAEMWYSETTSRQRVISTVGARCGSQTIVHRALSPRTEPARVTSIESDYEWALVVDPAAVRFCQRGVGGDGDFHGPTFGADEYMHVEEVQEKGATAAAATGTILSRRPEVERKVETSIADAGANADANAGDSQECKVEAAIAVPPSDAKIRDDAASAVGNDKSSDGADVSEVADAECAGNANRGAEPAAGLAQAGPAASAWRLKTFSIMSIAETQMDADVALRAERHCSTAGRLRTLERRHKKATAKRAADRNRRAAERAKRRETKTVAATVGSGAPGSVDPASARSLVTAVCGVGTEGSSGAAAAATDSDPHGIRPAPRDIAAEDGKEEKRELENADEKTVADAETSGEEDAGEFSDDDDDDGDVLDNPSDSEDDGEAMPVRHCRPMKWHHLIAMRHAERHRDRTMPETREWHYRSHCSSLSRAIADRFLVLTRAFFAGHEHLAVRVRCSRSLTSPSRASDVFMSHPIVAYEGDWSDALYLRRSHTPAPARGSSTSRSIEDKDDDSSPTRTQTLQTDVRAFRVARDQETLDEMHRLVALFASGRHTERGGGSGDLLGPVLDSFDRALAGTDVRETAHESIVETAHARVRCEHVRLQDVRLWRTEVRDAPTRQTVLAYERRGWRDRACRNAPMRYATNKRMWLPDGTPVYAASTSALPHSLRVACHRLDRIQAPGRWVDLYGVRVPTQLDLFRGAPHRRDVVHFDPYPADVAAASASPNPEHAAAFAAHAGAYYNTTHFVCPSAHASGDGERVVFRCALNSRSGETLSDDDVVRHGRLCERRHAPLRSDDADAVDPQARDAAVMDADVGWLLLNGARVIENDPVPRRQVLSYRNYYHMSRAAPGDNSSALPVTVVIDANLAAESPFSCDVGRDPDPTGPKPPSSGDTAWWRHTVRVAEIETRFELERACLSPRDSNVHEPPVDQMRVATRQFLASDWTGIPPPATPQPFSLSSSVRSPTLASTSVDEIGRGGGVGGGGGVAAAAAAVISSQIWTRDWMPDYVGEPWRNLWLRLRQLIDDGCDELLRIGRAHIDASKRDDPAAATAAAAPSLSSASDSSSFGRQSPRDTAFAAADRLGDGPLARREPASIDLDEDATLRCCEGLAEIAPRLMGVRSRLKTGREVPAAALSAAASVLAPSPPPPKKHAAGSGREKCAPAFGAGDATAIDEDDERSGFGECVVSDWDLPDGDGAGDGDDDSPVTEDELERLAAHRLLVTPSDTRPAANWADIDRLEHAAERLGVTLPRWRLCVKPRVTAGFAATSAAATPIDGKAAASSEKVADTDADATTATAAAAAPPVDPLTPALEAGFARIRRVLARMRATEFFSERELRTFERATEMLAADCREAARDGVDRNVFLWRYGRFACSDGGGKARDLYGEWHSRKFTIAGGADAGNASLRPCAIRVENRWRAVSGWEERHDATLRQVLAAPHSKVQWREAALTAWRGAARAYGDVRRRLQRVDCDTSATAMLRLLKRRLGSKRSTRGDGGPWVGSLASFRIRGASGVSWSQVRTRQDRYVVSARDAERESFRLRDLERGFLLSCDPLGDNGRAVGSDDDLAGAATRRDWGMVKRVVQTRRRSARRPRLERRRQRLADSGGRGAHDASVAAPADAEGDRKGGEGKERKEVSESSSSDRMLETGVHRQTASGQPSSGSYEVGDDNAMRVGDMERLVTGAAGDGSLGSVYKLAAATLDRFPEPVIVEIALVRESQLTERFASSSSSSSSSLSPATQPLASIPESALPASVTLLPSSIEMSPLVSRPLPSSSSLSLPSSSLSSSSSSSTSSAGADPPSASEPSWPSVDETRDKVAADDARLASHNSKALADWGHEKLALTLGRVRSIRPVCWEGAGDDVKTKTMVYQDEHRGELCASCWAAPSTTVQLCSCRTVFYCGACARQILAKYSIGQCFVCRTHVTGMHTLDAQSPHADKWRKLYRPAPDGMATADAARRFSLPVAYSFIAVEARGERVTYRLGELAHAHVSADEMRRRALGRRCGPGLGVFATPQAAVKYADHFDIPAWARG